MAVFAAYILSAVLIGVVMAHCAVAAPKLQRGELELMARVVQRESTGESALGQKAVAWTVINRLREPEVYGATVTKILTRKYQYAKPAPADDSSPAHLRAMLATVEALLGVGGDPSNGSTHFLRCDLRPQPAWARRFERRAVLGHHCFYRSRN
jgi:N-acetylmuramoyl-L-alanine amidase